MKTCTKCGQEKSLDQFGRRKEMRDGRRSECKPCQAAVTRKWYHANKERHLALHSAWHQRNKERAAARVRRRKYGLTHEDYLALLDVQGGVCAFAGCDVPPDHVDHDHASGLVRGLLCRSHNLLLGFAHDNPAELEAAIDYLNVHDRVQS